MDFAKPTLLVNEEIARRNIKRLMAKAKNNNVVLAPHFKTHQSRKIGRWFKEETLETLNTITVSSVSMAEYFAADGWRNIIVAFPVNILEISKISDLSSRVELSLLVTEIEQIKMLLSEVEIFVNVLIEIDCGGKRSGLSPKDHHRIAEMIDLLSHTQHHFQGFYSHFGHTYNAGSPAEVEQIFKSSLHMLVDLQFRFADVQPTISIGDTPSCSIINNFSHIDSVHAGNFVFYDLTQVQIGVCNEEDIAVALACPVVSKNDRRREIIIYGGGVHLSKESMYDKSLASIIFGKIVRLGIAGWSAAIPDCYLRSISQEHGVVKLSDEFYSQVRIGDVIGVLPVHSCMTADCMAGYVSLTGERIDHFKAIWPQL
jgi:D-serine deaminase-like pyridoxal phosphate-dependent protein